MVKLKKIWIEHDFGEMRAVRIDWDNDRHQRVEIKGSTPQDIARALKKAGALIDDEIANGKI